MDKIEEEEEAKVEQEIFTQHELKVMDLIDRIGKIIAIPYPIENKENTEKISFASILIGLKILIEELKPKWMKMDPT